MGLPINVSKSLAAASANNIALSQSLGAAGNLTINGSAATAGVATLDTARRVILTSAGNDSGLTWTVTGTNQTGNLIVDKFAGGNIAAAQSNYDFLTITSIAGSAATAAAVTAGTNTVGSTPWIGVNWHSPIINIGIGVQVTGTVNYTVQHTFDDPNNLPSGVSFPATFNHPSLQSLTASGDGDYIYPIIAMRLLINSGTGTARMVAIQADISGA